MTQAYNYPNYNSNRYNVNVLASGLFNGNGTVEVIGTAPPATGCPVFILGYPQINPVIIKTVDPIYGTILVQPVNQNAQQDSWYKTYPHDVNVWKADAITYMAFPTGVGCTLRGHTIGSITGAGPVRGVDSNGSPNYIYG